MDAENIDGGDGRPPGCTGKVAVSIYRYFPYGGLQKDMMNTVMALRSRNVDVTIFCMSWEASEIPENVTVRRLRLSASTSARRARKFDLALSRVLKKRDFDLHLSFNKVASADCYFVDDLPFARSDYKTPWWRRIFSVRWRIYSHMERQVFGGTSNARIFCLGEAQKRFYQSIYSTADSRFKILPPGVEDIFCDALKFREERREVTRRELGLGKEDKALFLVGSAFYAKGVDRAIAALASLPDRISADTRLFIVGNNDESYFRNFAKRCGVDDRVVFLGPRHDVPHLLAAADLLAEQGMNVCVVNCHTIKPFDVEGVQALAAKYKKVFTVEEHSVIGGLGDATAAALVNMDGVHLTKLGLNDEFGQSGKPADLLKAYKLDAAGIAASVMGK